MSIQVIVAESQTISHSNSQNCKNKLYTARSYTFNLRSYKDAADKDARCLIRNLEGKEGLLAGRISIRKQLPDEEHASIWRHFMDRTRKAGYSIYFVREWLPVF